MRLDALVAQAKLVRRLNVTLVGTPEQWVEIGERMTASAKANRPSKARVKAAVALHERMDRDPSFERRVLSRYGRTRLDPRTVLALVGGHSRAGTDRRVPVGRRAPRGRRVVRRARSRSPGRLSGDDEPSEHVARLGAVVA